MNLQSTTVSLFKVFDHVDGVLNDARSNISNETFQNN